MCNRPDFSTDKLPIESFDRCCIVVVNLLFVLLHVKRNSRFNFVTCVSYVMCHAWHDEFWRYSQRDLDLKPWIVWRDPWNLKQTSKLDPSQIAWWKISFQSKIYDDSRHVGFPKFHRWFSHLTFSHLQHRRLEDDFPLESTYFSWSYCWWTKSCTTKYDDNPIIYRVLTIPNGAGFLPSTVVLNWTEIFAILTYLARKCWHYWPTPIHKVRWNHGMGVAQMGRWVMGWWSS